MPIRLVAENGRWEHAGQRYFDGEVEPCINGRTIEAGAYFGVDVAPIVERVLGERLADGGWNCEAENGSVRSSFHTTIDVLDGLLEFEQATGGTAAVQDARRSGEEYLLERRLFRRQSTGEVVDPAFLDFAFPYYWRYDVLRALDYFRRAGATPDPRMAEAIEVVRLEAPARRPVAARPHPPGSRPLRPRSRRRAEPVEHPPRPSGTRLVGAHGRVGRPAGAGRHLHTFSTPSPSVAPGPARRLGLSPPPTKGATMKPLTSTIAALLVASGLLASSNALASSSATTDVTRPAATTDRPVDTAERGDRENHRGGFERFLERYEAANTAFVNGDAALWRAMTTENGPASIFGGFGGLGESGVAEVNERYVLAARAFQASGAEVEFEYLVKDVEGRIAYTVAIERADVLYTRQTEPHHQVLRATMMFRFERGGWKIVHRHADTMVDLQLPMP